MIYNIHFRTFFRSFIRSFIRSFTRTYFYLNFQILYDIFKIKIEKYKEYFIIKLYILNMSDLEFINTNPLDYINQTENNDIELFLKKCSDNYYN